MTDGEKDDGVSKSVWRYAMADRANVIIDVDGYFELMRDAMCNARQQIFLIGWDFDTRIHLSGGRRWWNLPRRSRYPARLGAFIVWLAKRTKTLDVRILKWNFAFFKFLFRGSMIIDLIRWWTKERIDFKFDSAHPVGCSHHQKIVVIDDRLAACGGIDMTSDRWDTRLHRDDDPRRRLPGGRRKYGPWHDITMMMEGEVASALGELGRRRWELAGGEPLDCCSEQIGSPWPKRLQAQFTNVEVGIARTRSAYLGNPQVAEIEELFVEQIGRARYFVYAETQYFASRRIAEAIQARLQEPEPPEFVIVHPQNADGWLEQMAMDTARARILNSMLPSDHARRFHLYVPYTTRGAPIYVHAKFMIVDDRILRVGSANMNNRSMGLDSECDVFLDADRPANAHIEPTIRKIRYSLLAEHCGLSEAQVAAALDDGRSMAAMIDSLPKSGKHLARFVPKDISEFEGAIADGGFLDPERPGEWMEPIGKRGLFRKGGKLRRPVMALKELRRRLSE
ncbi:MAG TPA: phospholipase D-like domain-containing protein [Novosphingobium sp.]|nr:phospholipase D-like domain-containing protein [Novosphingobium sp.]